MSTDKKINLKKCGEMLIDINTKVRKNKMFIFQCTFCNVECDQLKKFSTHIGQHLDSAESILKETALKIEVDTIEIGSPAFANIEKAQDIAVENSEQETQVNSDPLDTLNPAESSDCQNENILIQDIKREKEINQNSISNNEELEYTNENDGDSHQDKLEFDDTTNDNKIETESEDEIKDDIPQIPLKKRKILESKRKKIKSMVRISICILMK